MSGGKSFPMPGSVWRWTGDHTTPPSGPHTVATLVWAYGAPRAMMGDRELYDVAAMMRSDAWVCEAASGAPPTLSWAQAVDIVKALAPHGDVARRAAAVIRIAEGRGVAPDAEATTGRDGDEDAHAEAAAGLLHTMGLHPHYPLRYRSNWAACLAALDVLAPEAARRLRAGEAPGDVERALFPSSDNGPASDGCPDGCGAAEQGHCWNTSQWAPKVGTWQPAVLADRIELLYDDRGQPVGGYNPRSAPGHEWFAARPLLGPATGIAATPSLARRAILEVLKTWADVSAVETE